MRLIHKRGREEEFYAAVRALHCLGIFVVERAFVLIYKYPVLGQRLIAVAVKFLCEQTLARAERVGAVDDYQVVFVLDPAHEFQPVLIENVNARVVQLTSRLRQVFPTKLDYAAVYLHHVDMLNTVKSGQLAYRSAVPRAYHQNLFNVGIGRHRDVGNHLVIYVLVLFGEHEIAVQNKYPAKLNAVEDIYFLKLALLAYKVLLYLD